MVALQSFHAVAKTGGISAAAAELGLAKSAVSRHVAQLEAHFSVKLLERGARSVRLTPVGARLDTRIASILAEVNLLGDIASEERAGVSGQVTVAATPEFGGLVATRVFPQIQALHPGLKLVMRPQYAFEDMQDPGTDLAFRVGTFRDDRLVARHIGGFRRWLVASPAFVADRSIQQPKDLADEPCLTFRGDQPGATWRFSRGGLEAGVDVDGPLAVHSFQILHDLAIAGKGVAFLPSFMTRSALAAGQLVQLLPDWDSPVIPVYLSFRPGARNIARVAAVIDLAERVAPTLLPPDGPDDPIGT